MGFVAAGGVVHAAVTVMRHNWLGRHLHGVAWAALRTQIGTYTMRGFFAGLTLAVFLFITKKIIKHRTRRRRAFLMMPLVLAIMLALVLMVATHYIRSPLADQFASDLSPWLIGTRIIIPALTDPISLPRAFIAIALLVIMTISFLICTLAERLIFRKDELEKPAGEPSYRFGIIGLVLLFFLSAAYVEAHPRGTPPGMPDIVLVSIDTLRADHLGCYGYGRPTSPNIDALANEGILVEDHIAQSPWTLPAHITMFTGLAPFEHGVTKLGNAISPRRTVLGELLKERGYKTGAFVTSYLLSPTFGYESGFDSYILRADFPAEETVRLATSWLSRNSSPAFLFLHLYDPHYPYAPRKAFKGKFNVPDDGLDEVMRKPFFDFSKQALAFTPAQLDSVIARYDEKILDVDAQLGKLFAFLHMTGRYDRAWIIVTADHGEEFKDHGLFGHSITLFDEMLRVPLIIKAPESACAGTRFAGAIPQKAIFTLIKSISEMKYGKAVEYRDGKVPAFIEALAAGEGVLSESEVFAPHRFAIRKDGRKLIEPYKFDLPPFSVNRGLEHYDLKADPKEQKNIFAEGADEELQDILVKANAARDALAGKEVGASNLSPEAKEKLKSLGYVQ